MTRTLLSRAYYAGLALIRADRYRMRKMIRGRKVVVLNLHRVSPVDNPYWSPLHPRLFEELLRYLQQNFRVCSLAELGSITAPDKPLAVLSFDDGYYDFIEYALPLLERYRMPSNMNVIPQCAETGIPIWNVRLYDFLWHAPRELVDEIALPGFEVRLRDDSREAKVGYGLAISKYLKQRPRTERQDLWRAIEPLLARLDHQSTRMMTTQEIRSIAGKVEIGAHSYAHESMGFEDSDYFEEDFAACDRYFREELAYPFTIYAFPNGSYRPDQIPFLERHGIKYILLVEEEFGESIASVLQRVTIYGNDSLQIKMKVMGF